MRDSKAPQQGWFGEKAGAVALLGSGEYLPVMNDPDRLLLETIGGPASARVALIPMASGLEPGAPERWNQLGLDHFRELGVEAMALPLVTREDAEAEALLEQLRLANVFYFSGGSPPYLVETLRGTRAWMIIESRHRQGAAVAGCSAGAIMLGAYRFNLRAVMEGAAPAWESAMGVVPGLAVLAHFDRASRRFGLDAIRDLLGSAPPGVIAVGIDEDTVLLRVPTMTGGQWQVQGRQTVTIFPGRGQPTIYKAGEIVPLDEILRVSEGLQGK